MINLKSISKKLNLILTLKKKSKIKIFKAKVMILQEEEVYIINKKKYDLFFRIFSIYKEIFIQISINLFNFYIDKCSEARIFELF